MKARSLFCFTVSLAIAGVSLLSRLPPATSAPAPTFRPILRDIQNQLPRGMVMRLPASLELTDFQGKKITMYPILEPYRRGEFRLSLVTEPSCQARYCQIGYIAAFQKNQNSDNPHLAQRSSGVPVNLGEKVRAVYVAVDSRGASSGPYGLVIWEQNNLTFLVSLPFNPNLTLAQNKQKIIDIAASMANELPIYDIATANSQVTTGRSQQLTRCVRWSVFSQSLGEMGRGAPYRAFNELPNGFKQGCIFFQDNNSIDVAYVLKDGVEPSATLTNGQFSYGGVPSFSSEQSKQFDNLMARGQALMITWLTPTQGSLPYVRSIPKDRAFVRDDGMVCFNTVCMKSSAVSNQELSGILEAGQIATGRSPQLPPRTVGRKLEAYNIACTNNFRTIWGQQAADYCTSADADSGILFEQMTEPEFQTNGSIKINKMIVFNRGSADALIEVYDSKGKLVDLKRIEGNKPPTGLFQSINPFDANSIPASLFSKYPLGDRRRNLKEQEISNITIPPDGRVTITKSSDMARLYNAAMYAIEYYQLKQGNPKFAESESVRKFVLDFAKDTVLMKDSRTVINIFTSEPSAQAIFSLDLIDPTKLAEVLQKLLQYSVTVDGSDPSQNPFIGAFKGAFEDGANIGIEKILNILAPGLGDYARAVRLGGDKLNLIARVIDVKYATASGEKATITIRNAVYPSP